MSIMSRLLDEPIRLPDKTIKNALTLFSREAASSAHMPFIRKDKPLDLPADGFELAAKLAIHSSFRQLTIAHLSQNGRFQVAGEFRLIHDLATFAESKVVALVFDPTANGATPFVLSDSNDIEDEDWQGPTIEALLECDSVDELKALMLDTTKHNTTYTEKRTMVYFPPGLLKTLTTDVLLQDDIPRLCYHLGKRCKELAITHLKNGRVRKGIQSHIASLFQFLVYHIVHDQSTSVEFTEAQEDMCDQYFADLVTLFPAGMTKPVSQDDEDENIEDAMSIESIESDEEIEEVQLPPSHQKNHGSNRSSDLPDIPREILQDTIVPSSESEKSSDSDTDSEDDEIKKSHNRRKLVHHPRKTNENSRAKTSFVWPMFFPRQLEMTMTLLITLTTARRRTS